MIFWSSRFSIIKILFAYGTTILETPKTVKGNFDILKNVGVQEEKCRGARRNCPTRFTNKRLKKKKLKKKLYFSRE